MKMHQTSTKTLSILILTFLIFSSVFSTALEYDIMGIGELRGLSVDQELSAFTGSNQAFGRIAAAQYRDLGQTEKSAALRMALLGVMKGTGTGTFSPGTTVKNIEGLILINRLMGNEAAVVQGIAANIVGVSPENAASQLRDAHYDQALSLGITTESEGQSYFAPLSRELFMAWIARAIGLAPETATPLLDATTDDGAIAAEKRGLIEALLKEKIVSPVNNALRPKAGITRREAAQLLDAVAPRFFAGYGLEESFGVVIGINNETVNQYGKTLTVKSVVLRLEDGTLTQLKVQSGMKDGTDTEIATLKGGKVTGLSALAIGDEVRLLMSDATTVQIAEVLPAGSVLSRMKASLETQEGIEKLVGNIEQIIPETQMLGDTQKQGYRLRVRSVEGILNDLLVLSDSKTGIRSDVIVTKGGVLTYGNQYVVGGVITYFMKDNTEVIYLSLDQVGQMDISGTLQRIEKDAAGRTLLTVYDYSNRLHRLLLSPNAAITVNFRPTNASELKVGSEVRILVVDQTIARLTTESYLREPGYIPAGGRIVMGQVQYINGTQLYLIDQPGVAFMVNSQTVIMKDGVRASLYTLKMGDNVKFFLNSISDNTLGKVEIEGPEQLLHGLYKATLQDFKLIGNTLSLLEPYGLNNQEWVKQTNLSLNLPLAKDVLIYQGGRAVSKSALTGYKGQTLYMATRQAYGKEEIVKIVIKGANERVYTDTVALYDPVVSKLELVSKVNVTLPEGVIVVRDGRLVTQSAIEEDSGIFVVGSSALGTTEAAIVEVVPASSSPFDVFFAGAIDVVNTYAIQFSHSYHNENYGWTDSNGGKWFMSDDTVIKDLSGVTPVAVTRYQLFHGAYSVEENKDTDGDGLDYERYYSFFVVAPGTQDIIGMSIRKKELLKDKPIDDAITSESRIDDEMEEALMPLLYTRGVIEAFDVKWNRIRLRNAYDYVTYHEEWSPTGTAQYVELPGTIIVKGDRVIGFEDLKIGDRVLLVRDNEDALFLKVEE